MSLLIQTPETVGKPGPAVRVEHLSLKYGGHVALDDVALSVERGSIGVRCEERR